VNWLIVLLLAGSGAAALTYEIVWFQLLELVIGSSALSVGVLLGTFMGGMCLGSMGFPRSVSARRHPLRVYAALELAIGAYGLLLLGVMPAVGRTYTAWGGSGAAGFAVRATVAAICLVPPTLAMGATLPAIARLVGNRPARFEALGLFYTGNIAGGVCGALAAGFYLLRVYDVATATYAAVSVNLLVGAGSLWLATANRDLWAAASSPAGDNASRGRPESGSWPSAVYLAIAISGLCALTGEVVWTRLLGLLFGPTVYTLALIVAVFLIGMGIGSSVGAALVNKVDAAWALGSCQALLVVAIGWTSHEVSASLPYWPINPSLSSSIWLNFKLDFLRALWALLPPASLWGASVPLALASFAREEPDAGRLVGGVYAANTIGAVVGALTASLLLIRWIGSQRTEQAMMALSGVAACVLLVSRRAPRERRLGTLAACGVVLLAPWVIRSVPRVPGLLIAHGRFAATFVNQQVDIIYAGEGLQASVAVSRLANGQLGYHNAGKIQASSAPEDMRLQRVLGHLTTLVPRRPRSVLVIGCGAGVTAGAVSVDPLVERVTIAEIEPLVPRVASSYFGPQNFDVVRNPKVTIHIDDGRHYLQTTRETFDAITSDPLDPWVRGAAMLYTKEFFETVRDHLRPGGVVTLFVQLYDSSPEAVKSEIATFFHVFPNGMIAGNSFRGVGYDTVLLGQVEPLRIDLDAVQARLDRPEYARLVGSLREVGLRSAVDLFSTYAGRAADLGGWLRGASINGDRNLRLQYLAGLGLNMNESDAVYAELLTYRRYPQDAFVGSDQALRLLRDRIGAGP
jgi:spermidine synthase